MGGIGLKMKSISYIYHMFIIIFLLIIFIFIIGTIVQQYLGMNHNWIEEGDCFDREWNKINNLTCDVDKYCSEFFISLYPKCSEEELN